MKSLLSVHIVTVSLFLSSLQVAAQRPQPLTSDGCEDFAAPRLTVVISDLHLGQGKAGSKWSPYEDFRWSQALAGLLGYVRQQGLDQADLVVAGDLLELWQHPKVTCSEKNKDYGCTIDQMETIARQVAQAHRKDLEELGRFAAKGSNRVVIVPGNHDAALMLDRVWNLVHSFFKAPRGKVCRAAAGTWVSPDGFIVVQHGHQIGVDVNGFPDWPKVTGRIGKKERMFKTWGESFVQQLYNKVEPNYPLIDNLQPTTGALWDYLRNEGLVQALPRDLARFISFNLFSTSFRQKLKLGGSGTEEPSWDTEKVRSRGWRLFADALPDGDTMRAGLLAESLAVEWQAARNELNALANNPSILPPEEVKYLCDQIKIQIATSKDTSRMTCDTVLGGEIFQRVVPENRRMAAYLEKLRQDHPAMKAFVYGHTHSLRACWEVKMSNGHFIPIFNSGAFHRLVDKDMFEVLAGKEEPKLTPEEALAKLPLEHLPACYPVVVLQYQNGVPRGKLWNWYMEEGSPSGGLIPACDTRCALINESLCSGEKGGLCAGVTQ